MQPSDWTYHCSIPWMNFSASYAGLITHGCCDFAYSGIPWDVDSGLDIAGMWNSAWFAEQRRIFRGDSLEGTGCAWCRRLKEVMDPALPTPPKGMNALQRANFETAVREFTERREAVSHFPVRYTFDVGRKCNINCTMCLQKDSINNDARTFDADVVLDQADILARADAVGLYGGEPTFIPAGREVLHALLTHDTLKDVRLKLSTNGQLLGDFIPDMAAKRRMHLILSVDAYGETYERIRKGARWQVLERNLKDILALQRRDDGVQRDWTIELNAVLMKSTLAALDEYTAWCVDVGAKPLFNALFPTRYTHDEDIFNAPELLDDLDDWEGALERSSARLGAAGHQDSSRQLSTYLRQLRAARAKGAGRACNESEGRLRAILADMHAQGQLDGRTAMVWGTGSNYATAVAPELERYTDKLRVLGFLDNNAAVHGARMHGMRVHPPAAVRELDPDMVIVASWHYDAIRKQLAEMGYAGLVL